VIGYLQGRLLKKDADRILLLAGDVGYEVLLPAFVMDTLGDRQTGADVSLYIFHQQTERQPRPVLIGFHLEAEREFFQHFISVEDIGPLKAVKALTIPIREIAIAIETADVGTLKQLKGIGPRTAQKIIATLAGKMEKFALIRKAQTAQRPVDKDFAKPVLEVLVDQLGHRKTDAKRMVANALKRNPGIASPEDLFEEVYRGEVGT
jgi:Holliday junction DNA helicase RuvA